MLQIFCLCTLDAPHVSSLLALIRTEAFMHRTLNRHQVRQHEESMRSAELCCTLTFSIAIRCRRCPNTRHASRVSSDHSSPLTFIPCSYATLCNLSRSLSSSAFPANYYTTKYMVVNYTWRHVLGTTSIYTSIMRSLAKTMYTSEALKAGS